MKPIHYLGLAVTAAITVSGCYKSRDRAALDNSQARVEELLKEKKSLEGQVETLREDKEKLRRDWDSCDSRLRGYTSKADAGNTSNNSTADASTHVVDAGLRTTDAGNSTAPDAGYIDAGHSTNAGITRHPLLEGMVNGRYDPIMIQDGENLPAYLQISKECTSNTSGCDIVLEVRYEADHPGYSISKERKTKTDGGNKEIKVLFQGKGVSLTWDGITDIYICNSNQCSTTRPQDVADTYKPIFENLVVETYRAAEDTFRKVTAAPKFK